MKIIRDGHCYIQVEDIMYLFRNDPSFPRSMYYDYISTYGLTLNPGSYIELETSLYNS